jgi:hypothetical protein
MDGVLYFYYADKRVGISFETEILANQWLYHDERMSDLTGWEHNIQ